MPRHRREVVLPGVFVDRRHAEPAYQQIYVQIRGAILKGTLKGGSSLPSTRALAEALGISRNSAIAAYEQLAAEGYITGRQGSGNFVTERIPDGYLSAEWRAERVVSKPSTTQRTVHGGRSYWRTPSEWRDLRPFRPGFPDVRLFPIRLWSRVMNEVVSARRSVALLYSDSRGTPELRRAIARHLGERRAVLCDPAQVFIVPGSQYGLDLMLRVLLKPGDTVWMEDPGYFGAHTTFAAAGLRTVPIPVDGEGAHFGDRLRASRGPAAIFVTPSHQYPVGSTLSLGRRLALLEYAARTGAWVIEDDYDSVFRYEGRPLPALQGLDSHGRVIYLGTFSKTMFPGLRIGYLVVPEQEVDRFSASSAFIESICFAPAQLALARFIEDGHLDRHIRRMRDVYGSRRTLLEKLIRDRLSEWLAIRSEPSGMNLMAWLDRGLDDQDLIRRAAGAVQAVPVSALSLRTEKISGLLFGFAAFREGEIRKGVDVLARFV